MKVFTLGEANRPRKACNDNWAPAHCIEVFCPDAGWVIHVDRGSGHERLTLHEFIETILIIENSRFKNVWYRSQAKDMRDCLDRIKSFGVIK